MKKIVFYILIFAVSANAVTFGMVVYLKSNEKPLEVIASQPSILELMLENNHALEVALNAKVSKSDNHIVDLSAKVALQMSDGIDSIALSGELNVPSLLGDNNYLHFAYIDGKIYVDLLQGKYMVDYNVASHTLKDDLPLLLATITSMVPASDMEIIQGLDIDSLMGEIMDGIADMTERALEEGGYEVSLPLGRLGTVVIQCEDDYRIRTVDISPISFGDFRLECDIDISTDNIIVATKNNPDDYIDITPTVNIVSPVVQLLQAGSFESQIEINYQGEQIKANFGVDFNDIIKFRLETEFRGLPIEVIYLDGIAYAKIGSLKLQYQLRDLSELEIVLNKLGVELPEGLLQTISEVLNGGIEKLPIKDLLGVTASGEITLPQLDFIESLSYVEGIIQIKLKSGASLMLDSSREDSLISLDFEQDGLGLNICIIGVEADITIPEDVSKYGDASILVTLLERAARFLEGDNFSGNAEVVIGKGEQAFNLNLEYVIGYKDSKLNIDLRTKLYGVEIEAYYRQGEDRIYLNAGGLKTYIEAADITRYISELTGKDLSDALDNVMGFVADIDGIIEALKNIDLTITPVEIMLSLGGYGIELNLHARDIGSVSVSDKGWQLVLTEGEEAKANVTIEPTEYEAFEKYYRLINSTKQLIETGKYAAQVGITYQGTRYLLDVDIDLSNGYALKDIRIKVSGTIAGLDIEVVVLGEDVYLNIHGTKIGVKIGEIQEALIVLLGEDLASGMGGILPDLEYLINAPKSIQDDKVANRLNVYIGDYVLNLGYDLDKITEVNLDIAGIAIKLDLGRLPQEIQNVNSSEYYVVSQISGLLKALKAVYQEGVLAASGTLDIVTDKITINLSLDIKVAWEDELCVDINTSLKGVPINVQFIGRDILVNAGGLKIKAAIDDLNDLVEWGKNLFGEIDLSNIDFADVLKGIDITNQSAIIRLDKGSLEILFEDKITEVSGQYDMVSLALNTYSFDGDIIRENIAEYTHYNEILPVIDGIMEMVNAKQFDISGEARVYNDEGQRFLVSNLGLKADLNGSSGIKLWGTATVDDFAKVRNVALGFESGMLYFDFDGMKIALNSESIKQFAAIGAGLLGLDSSILTFLDSMEGLNASTESLQHLFPKLSLDDPLAILAMVKGIIYNSGIYEIVLDASYINDNATQDMLLRVHTELGRAVRLEVKNFYSGVEGNEYFDLDVFVNTYTEIPEVEGKGDYIDLSTAVDLVKGLLNTAENDNFTVTGRLVVDLKALGFIPFNADVGLKLELKVVDTVSRKFVMYLETTSDIPVITLVNNDVPYKFGDVNGGQNRRLKVYYADGFVYFHRTEKVKKLSGTRNYEKKLKVSLQTFMADPIKYLQYCVGFSNDITNAIREALARTTNRTEPIDFAKLLLGYSQSGENHNLILNMKELTANPDLDKMSVDLKTKTINGKLALDRLKLNMNMPIPACEIKLRDYDGFVVNTDLNVDANKVWSFVNSYPYAENQYWEKG